MVSKTRLSIFKKKMIAYEILRFLLLGGVILVALSNPYGAPVILKELRKEFGQKLSKRDMTNAFYRLKRKNLITVESRNGSSYINLSSRGEFVARHYSIFQAEKIAGKAAWDGNWFIVFFDVDVGRKNIRDALRFLLKRLGFVQLQKSVWVIPFDCRPEVEELKVFFGLSDEEVRMVVTKDLGNMARYKRLFKLDV